ncbi:MAG TPA: hypothetical protein VGS41_18010 [Chthonomonadales bacterium]|nr:hypothetical protein [Chthonomonadales bacterium]
MQYLYCEVIGCGNPAGWVLQAGEDSQRELYLCDRCWLEQRARLPQIADLYIRLTAVQEAAMQASATNDPQSRLASSARCI